MCFRLLNFNLDNLGLGVNIFFMTKKKSAFWSHLKNIREKEDYGVEVEYFDVKFRIRLFSAGSSDYESVTRLLSEAEKEGNSLQVMTEVCSGQLVLGWEGLVNEETGEDIPYSREECHVILEENPSLVIDLINIFAREQAKFTEHLAESKKNYLKS